MKNISIVFTGPRYSEFHISYSVCAIREIFPDCEIILSTNDKLFSADSTITTLFDKIILCENKDELPSLKFSNEKNNTVTINNNINKQVACCHAGVSAASAELVLRLRTDQLITSANILKLWENIKDLPKAKNNKQGRIITSSIFSINPRYSERMPFHISDMLQFGYKMDVLDYFTVPTFPFEYAVWYETNTHDLKSNENEKSFRAKYAVEQWLALNYIYGNEQNFPIKYHNDCNKELIELFEETYIDYFIVAHPEDISLRASKFLDARSYYNTQCYSTHECLRLLIDKYKLSDALLKVYTKKGINKKAFKLLMPVIYFSPVQALIRNMPEQLKKRIKYIINNLTK